VQPSARVALIDDHALFREGLRVVLGQAGRLEVTGEAASVRDALELVAGPALDIAVVDVALPDGSGASVTRELRRLQPRCKVLVLSMIAEPYQVAELLRTGAAGYALKSQPTDEILDVHMPGGNGTEILAWVRNHAPRLPVVVTSGLPEDDPRIQAAMALPPVSYVCKPIDLRKLLRSLDATFPSARHGT